MRPLELTMIAFGPYRDRETIDFTQLKDRRLFVISGMTGAGKTSIFDAISYALYGSASGEDRADVRMLRSHFADEEIHTAVDFRFASDRRIYRVFRQMGHRKGTNKSETGGRIELYEIIDDEEIPCVDKFTISEVNAKIEEIIGLTREQFHQIVMLPQGEFRKLLTSDTENKEDILRRIFRTGRFQRLEDRFYEKSRELRDQLKEKQAKLAVHLQQAAETLPEREDSELTSTLRQENYNPSQVMDGLKQEQAYYAELAQDAERSRSEVANRLKELELEHRRGSEVNRLFTELEERRARQQELESRSEEMKALERKLQTAELAARIEPYEQYAVQAEREVALKKQLHADKQRELEHANQLLEQARERYEREQERTSERSQLELEINRLHELQPVVVKLDVMQREIKQQEQKKDAASATLAKLDQQLQESREFRRTLVMNVQQLEEETKQLPMLVNERERLRHKARLLQELSQLERQMQEYERLEEQQRQALKQIREEHDRLEAAWIEGQASLLAEHLHDGKPCPVCGSIEHPARAMHSGDRPTREILMQRKEELRQVEQELHAAAAQVAAARSSWSHRSELMDEYGIKAGGYDEQLQSVIARGKELTQTIEQLQRQTEQLAELKRKYNDSEKQFEQMTADRERVNQELQDRSIRYSRELALLQSELTRIPVHLRTPESLKQALATHEARLGELNKAWEQARQELQAAERRTVELTAQQVSLAEQATEAQAKAAEAQQRFADELGKAGFASEETYAQGKLSEQIRQEYRRSLEEYRQAYLIVKEQIAELSRQLQDREPVDLTELEERIAETQQEQEAILQAKQQAERYRMDAERIYAAIERSASQAQQVEDQLAKVLNIYQALKGDNPLRMSFERYILIDYLEQILEAANIRLQTLSNGQYLLQRSERLEARGRQSGLGLDVYDAYTGQNRDVKTLSGGEKFNASLALALGMADIIQSHQGGVSIEMMFIDEGFGSLDEESLQKAVATLIDLQKAGRMIGVISHVPELKEAFPAVLSVEKTREGYSRTSLIVK